MNDLEITLFDVSLQRLASNFKSGNNYMDNFLQCSQSLDDSWGKTYIFTPKDRSKIVGYYNIGVGYIDTYQDGIFEKIGGSIHINNFALDKNYQGYEIASFSKDEKIFLSDILLQHCFHTIQKIRDHYLGFSFITLSSTKEGYNLYKRNGFEELENDMHFSISESDVECIPMYLALDIE